jgi:transposase
MAIPMDKKKNNLHLEIQRHRKKAYGVLRSTYRENGKYKHKTFARISDVDLDQLKIIQAALRGEKLIAATEAIKITNSKEYGASYVVLELVKKLGLDKIIYSKPSEQWVRDCLAMIVGRLIYAGSKLSLTNRRKDSALWELCGIDGAVDVDKHCYEPMDKLLARQDAIQKKLAEKHFQNGSLVLYDITSSYFEGEYEESELVTFGYNRDRKRGYEQIVIGLICTADGCPIGVEVFAGNTQDAATVENKIKEVQEKYNIKDITFIGDRGMITHANYEKLKDTAGLKVISALTHYQIQNLLNKEIIQLGLFDENNIVEIIDPENSQIRYCLCKNPLSAKRERDTRQALINKTTIELDKIVNSTKQQKDKDIGARVGKVLSKTKMGKFFIWEIIHGKLSYTIDNAAIAVEQALDGCYVIFSNASAKEQNKNEIVASYKKLALVEKVFRNLKTVQLEVRPTYHKKDGRIRSHVFLCMLAYYIQWHMEKNLKSLFETDGQGKERYWTIENIIERLKSIRRNDVNITGTICKIVNELDPDQQKILELLDIKL